MDLIVDALAYPEPAVLEAAIRRAVREQGITRYVLADTTEDALISLNAHARRLGTTVLTTPDRRYRWEPALDPTCDVAVWIGETRAGLPRAKARELVKKGLDVVVARSKKYADAAYRIGLFVQAFENPLTWEPEWQDVPADWFPASAPAVAKDYQLLLPDSHRWSDLTVAMQSETGLVGLDFETEGDYPFMQPVGFSASWAAGQAIYSPIDSYLTTEQRVFLVALVARPWVAHNAKFELHCLETLGVPIVETPHDTMVIAWEHGSIRKGLGLKALMGELFGERPTTFEEAARGRRWSEVPLAEAVPYACADADNCRRLYYELTENRRTLGDGKTPFVLGMWQNEHLYDNIDRPLIPVLQQMERRGVALDTALLYEWNFELATRLVQLEVKITEAVGARINLNSPIQVSNLLFDRLGLEPTRYTATGYSTKDDTLRQLKGQHPVVDLLLEHRELAKRRSTYAGPMLNIAQEVGTLYFGWDGTGTETGRMSSKGMEWRTPAGRLKGPQGQNIPLVARRAAVARPGHKLVAADYSQIELRILTHMSGDPVFLYAFREGRNPHVETMEAVFGTRDKTANGGKPYKLSKNINFGIAYGAGPERLVQQALEDGIVISKGDAADQLREHQRTYPVTWQYRADRIRTIRTRGYAETLHGRRVYYPDLDSPDPEKRAAAEREAFNEEIQGTAGDFTKAAMVDWDASTNNAVWPLLLAVHDELVVETPSAQAEKGLDALSRAMTIVAQPYLSLAVEVAGGIADNWADLKS